MTHDLFCCDQQIEGEVRRELDDGVLRPSPPRLPWPVSTVAQGCGGEHGLPVNTMPRTSVGRPMMRRQEHVAGEHEAEDGRGRRERKASVYLAMGRAGPGLDRA